MVYIHSDLNDTLIFNEILISPPVESNSKNELVMEINKENETFYFRTPKLKFKYLNNNSIKLYFKGKHKKNIEELYSFIYQLEQYLNPLIEKEIGNTFSVETKDIFRSCIQSPKKLSGLLHFKSLIDSNVRFFSESNNVIELNETENDNYEYGSFIISCDRIIITPTTAKLQLKIVQGKIYVKEQLGYGILNEDSEETKENKITIQLGE